MINRLPSRVLNWDSPYKVLYGNDLDFSVSRPFGCWAFAAYTHPSRDKFDSRSNKCIFFGYDANHKGYILLDLTNSKILVSRDVSLTLLHILSPLLTPQFLHNLQLSQCQLSLLHNQLQKIWISVNLKIKLTQSLMKNQILQMIVQHIVHLLLYLMTLHTHQIQLEREAEFGFLMF